MKKSFNFLSLTPFNPLLTLGIFLWANRDLSKSLILSFIISFLIVFGVEVTGVHIGKLFGYYQYRTALSLKLFEVPLIIGINWFLLAIIVGELLKKCKCKYLCTNSFVGAYDGIS